MFAANKITMPKTVWLEDVLKIVRFIPQEMY